MQEPRRENRIVLAVIFVLAFIAAGVLLATKGCGGIDPISRRDEPGPGATPEPCGSVVNYAGTIGPLLLASCAGAGCHGPAPFPYADAKAKLEAPLGILERIQLPASNQRHMPANGKTLGANQIAVLKQWKADGFLNDTCSGGGNGTPARTPQRTSGDDLNAIGVRYLVSKVTPERRRTTRCLSGTHLDDVGAGMFLAAKVMNSLSSDGRLVQVGSADDDSAVGLWCFDLADLQLASADWEVVVSEAKKQSVLYVTDLGRQFQALTGTQFPWLRADLFAAIALRDPTYRKIQGVLKRVQSQAQLEAKLGLNKVQEFKRLSPLLMGFEGRPVSGVALHNRLINLHRISDGVYAETNDFDNNGLAQQILGQFPLLGRVSGSLTSFLHAGGEGIFSLPNGLQGYYVVNNVGVFLDAVPLNVATNNLNANDPNVRNGVRCFQCHARGLYAAPSDSVLASLQRANPGIPESDRQLALALYRADDVIAQEIGEQNADYAAAIKRIGGDVNAPEPVTKYVDSLENDLMSLHRVAWEVHRSAIGIDGIESCIQSDANLSAQLSGLTGQGITRATFAAQFSALVIACQLGQERLRP